MKSNAVIARRFAKQMWGTVQGQKKLINGVWEYYTAGHGGIIVDTNEWPLLKEYNTIVFTRVNANTYYLSEQHFAAFEEDCDWAIPVYLYKEIAMAKFINSDYTEEFYKKYPTVEKFIENSVIPSIKQWNEKVLKNKE